MNSVSIQIIGIEVPEVNRGIDFLLHKISHNWEEGMVVREGGGRHMVYGNAACDLMQDGGEVLERFSKLLHRGTSQEIISA